MYTVKYFENLFLIYIKYHDIREQKIRVVYLKSKNVKWEKLAVAPTVVWT